tara:strand:+ start:1856 stop:2377 length:522 start_codon:yes stop_codon:yes gene_type:complete
MQQDIPAWIDGQLRPMDKLAVHRQGLRHPAVSVFVVCQGRLLIQRRALGKYHTPGLWANTCCTHPVWGEDPLDCAHRRLEQELGITGLTLEPRGVVEYRADVGGDMIEHEVVDLFLADCAARPPLTANPDEVMDTDWINAADLHGAMADTPAEFTPWLQIYLRDHGDQVLPGF